MLATANTTMRAAVIGAGPAGLAMLKNLRQEGLEATAFERLPHIGGNWKFTDDPTATSVLRGKSPFQWLRGCLLIAHSHSFDRDRHQREQVRRKRTQTSKTRIAAVQGAN